MNNILDKWIDALRSGEYKQIDRVLCDGNGGYCCLGVLQMVALDGQVETNEWGDYRGAPTPDFWSGVGTRHQNVFDTGISVEQLIKMNDVEGLSFAEIANKLEEGL